MADDEGYLPAAVVPAGDEEVLRALDKPLRKLEEFALLPADWDGEGGGPPTPATLGLAAQVLLAAAKRFGPEVGKRVEPYAVAPMVGGGIYLEWRSDAAELEVIVGQDGLDYLLVDKTEAERRFEEAEDVSIASILDHLARGLVPRS